MLIYGIKGFDEFLQCRKFQYEIGKEYIFEGNVKICNAGFHFSEKIQNVYSFYNKNRSRFCFVVGEVPDDKLSNWRQSDKVVTNKIKILKELTKEEIDILEKEQSNNKEITKDQIFRIEDVKKIQTAYPNFVLGGSSALYLQGFNIKRNNTITDLDFVIPYYTRMDLKDFNIDDNVTEVDQMDDCKNSGNDFDYTNAIVIEGDFILMDMRIDNKQKYKIVNYDNFMFKVCDWNIIIEAKMRYMFSSNGEKHKQDMMDMFYNPKPLVIDVKEEKIPLFKKLIEQYSNGEVKTLPKIKDDFEDLFGII